MADNRETDIKASACGKSASSDWKLRSIANVIGRKAVSFSIIDLINQFPELRKFPMSDVEIIVDMAIKTANGETLTGIVQKTQKTGSYSVFKEKAKTWFVAAQIEWDIENLAAIYNGVTYIVETPFRTFCIQINKREAQMVLVPMDNVELVRFYRHNLEWEKLDPEYFNERKNPTQWLITSGLPSKINEMMEKAPKIGMTHNEQKFIDGISQKIFK